MGEMKFTYVDVKEVLANLLIQELPKYGFSEVKIIKADPQSPAEIPCIGLNRIDDNETSGSLVDSHQTRYDNVTEEHWDYYGTFFQEAMEVRIWHTNGDAREKLFIHVKAILFAARTTLVEQGLLNVTLRSGRDEQDTTQSLAPMALYWSTITLSYLNPLDVSVKTTVKPITAFTRVTTHYPMEGENTDEQP